MWLCSGLSHRVGYPSGNERKCEDFEPWYKRQIHLLLKYRRIVTFLPSNFFSKANFQTEHHILGFHFNNTTLSVGTI